jgi:hypothetical protein
MIHPRNIRCVSIFDRDAGSPIWQCQSVDDELFRATFETGSLAGCPLLEAGYRLLARAGSWILSKRFRVEPVISAWKVRHRSVSGQLGSYDMRETVNVLRGGRRAGDAAPGRRGLDGKRLAREAPTEPAGG